MAFIEIENLSFVYENTSRYALHNINFTAEKGEFAIIAGESGSGKSTLLKLLKPQIAPYGSLSGNIKIERKALKFLEDRQSAFKIGYVAQDAESQTVCDAVWSELAFGLESLGKNKDFINDKIAEICAFFGINNWYRKKVSELSGGQRQILNLASVMVTEPEILLLDEPTSMLDPVARENFYNLLKKINRELGVTVLSVEHNLEDIFFNADKILILKNGSKKICGTPQEIVNCDKEIFESLNINLPTSVKLFIVLKGKGDCPDTLLSTKKFLIENAKNEIYELPKIKNDSKKETILEIKEGYFRYSKVQPDVLRGLNLKVYKGEILSVIGANGVGKTTLLRVLSGLSPLYSGSYKLKGKRITAYRDKTITQSRIAMLPQNSRTLFLEETVSKELSSFAKLLGFKGNELNMVLEKQIKLFGLEKILSLHPYDISGGEAEKLAIAKVLMLKPEILLLDEPTQSLDSNGKKLLSETIKNLEKQGVTVLMVTHDLDFSAKTATRCAMYFDGNIVGENAPEEFFGNMSIFTTVASRVSKGFYKNTVTDEQILNLYYQNEKFGEQNFEG